MSVETKKISAGIALDLADGIAKGVDLGHRSTVTSMLKEIAFALEQNLGKDFDRHLFWKTIDGVIAEQDITSVEFWRI